LPFQRPPIHSAAQVTRIDQRDADAFLACGVDQSFAQLVAVTVQVVELTDSRDPGLQHLSKHEPAVVEVVGGPSIRKAIHLVAPLPEVATARLSLPQQQTLEGM